MASRLLQPLSIFLLCVGFMTGPCTWAREICPGRFGVLLDSYEAKPLHSLPITVGIEIEGMFSEQKTGYRRLAKAIQRELVKWHVFPEPSVETDDFTLEITSPILADPEDLQDLQKVTGGAHIHIGFDDPHAAELLRQLQMNDLRAPEALASSSS